MGRASHTSSSSYIKLTSKLQPITTTSYTMEKAVGVFQHEKSEGLNEYLTALGVPLVAKKMITSTNPEVTISQDNEQWTVKFKVLIKTNTVVFKLGGILGDKPTE